MDASMRKNIAARDEALTKTGRVTRRVGAAAAAGSLVLMAGFAHLIPSHLPHLSGSSGGSGSGGSGGGSGTGTGTGGSGGTGTGGTGTGNTGTSGGTSSGTSAPGTGSGSGPTQVTSGGS
jgi:hypothetical protein